MANKIFDGRVNGKIGRGRRQLTFENTISIVVHVKSMGTSQRQCVGRRGRRDSGRIKRKREIETVEFTRDDITVLLYCPMSCPKPIIVLSNCRDNHE